jgi:hypothetical protein
VSVLSILYPYPSPGDGPQVSAVDDGIELLEGAWRAEARIQDDGTLLLLETVDGTETLRYAERGSDLQWIDVEGTGRFVEATGEGEIEWFLSTGSQVLQLQGLPFAVASFDGACGVRNPDGSATIQSRSARFGVRADEANGRPAAIVPSTSTGLRDAPLVLDGSASCDPEGDVLSYEWALISAPAGSRWPLSDTSSEQAILTPDVSGVYRVALRVTDSEASVSDPANLVVEVKELEEP